MIEASAIHRLSIPITRACGSTTAIRSFGRPIRHELVGWNNCAAWLRALGFQNVTVRHGDGYKGWPEHGPFDSIVVTAGASHMPQPLVDQLKPRGGMVIPVGGASTTQHLTLVEKGGEVHTRTLLPVRFVPLTGNR